MTPAQFQDMIAQLRRGNNRPLKVLFETYADYCVAGLQRHTGCQREDAEDIFQDAVLQFRENALEDRIKSTGKLKETICTVSVLTCTGRVRNNRRNAMGSYTK